MNSTTYTSGVPNGADWEKTIWDYVFKNPGQTSRSVAHALRLTRGGASGFLFKLSDRDMLTVKQEKDAYSGHVVNTYYPVVPYVPATRVRNKRTKTTVPKYDFTVEDGPIAIIQNAVRGRAAKDRSPKAILSGLNANETLALYRHLQIKYKDLK